ncbi:NAD(P)-binding protein [Exidia glandulosa HHB12029]|uniref:NAD(P)-binding protein n=1 Tax=Exidia glandulosa HHB12029 TaxID=1314781 RepID=A0A166ADK6_EXIGL|nr:NAD(P)-binding protein [Exidia glandulosa HHB12029]
MPRIATVFGATGLQGGSVVRALLKQGIFTPRAVTRDTSSAGAQELAKIGAEVVQGDHTNGEDVKKVISGAEVVFAVTVPDFTGKGTGGDLEQGKHIIDASKEAGVKFLVWSSTTDIAGPSGGKYTGKHLDDKAAVDEYLRASGLPSAILYTGGFLENLTRKTFLDFATLNEAGEISIKSRWGRGTLATLSWTGRDIGLSTAGLFGAYAAGRVSDIAGKAYLVAVAKLPIEELYERIEKALGKKVNVTWLEKVGFPALDDMYDSAQEFPWYPSFTAPDPALLALGVQIGTIEEFARTELKASLGL